MGLNALQVGSKVRFLDEVGNGVVTKIISDAEVMVEDDSGFEYPYDAGRLLVIEDA
jgi:hypothetical protein